jgi:hypothetical protein
MRKSFSDFVGGRRGEENVTLEMYVEDDCWSVFRDTSVKVCGVGENG